MSDGGSERLLPLVYKDAASGTVREVGEVLQRSVRLALAPVRAALWSAEQLEEFLATEVPKRLAERRVAPEAVHSPPANISAGTVLGLLVTGGEESLRAMYAELLATAMSPRAEDEPPPHPAFAEIIRQLSADDAEALCFVFRRTSAGRFSTWPAEPYGRVRLANLLRLGLLEDETPGLYPREPRTTRDLFALTPGGRYQLSAFGVAFCRAVLPREALREALREAESGVAE